VTDDIYQVNPIRYKDYYYDADTGWYNLTTRYYDPVVGRFISADDVSLIAESTDEMGDKNLYAYCDNNPISRADKGGEIWNFVIGAAIGAGIEIASQVITSGKITNWKAVGLSAAMGTIGGGAASAVSKVAGTAGKSLSLSSKAAKAVKPATKAAKLGKGTMKIKQPSMRARINDINKNPGKWRVTRQQVSKGTGKNHRNKWSIETQLRHKRYSWIKIYRHALTSKKWRIYERHYRPWGKFR
jgi:RHS repeat-associated protein